MLRKESFNTLMFSCFLSGSGLRSGEPINWQGAAAKSEREDGELSKLTLWTVSSEQLPFVLVQGQRRLSGSDGAEGD